MKFLAAHSHLKALSGRAVVYWSSESEVLVGVWLIQYGYSLGITPTERIHDYSAIKIWMVLYIYLWFEVIIIILKTIKMLWIKLGLYNILNILVLTMTNFYVPNCLHLTLKVFFVIWHAEKWHHFWQSNGDPRKLLNFLNLYSWLLQALFRWNNSLVGQIVICLSLRGLRKCLKSIRQEAMRLLWEPQCPPTSRMTEAAFHPISY